MRGNRRFSEGRRVSGARCPYASRWSEFEGGCAFERPSDSHEVGNLFICQGRSVL